VSLPDDDVVQHGASAKDDSQGDHDARADGWRRRELKYRIQDHIGEKDGDGDEESSNGADACGRRVLQEILNAFATGVGGGVGGRGDETGGEEQLSGADHAAAHVQRQTQRAQGQTHFVDGAGLFRRNNLHLISLIEMDGVGRRIHFEEEGERQEGHHERHQTEKTERRQHFTDADDAD